MPDGRSYDPQTEEDWEGEGVTPDIPLNISHEEHGEENCMSESMKCQVLKGPIFITSASPLIER